MSAPAVTLRQIVAPTDPVDCLECDGGYELRFWSVHATWMFCPGCGTPRMIAHVIQETRDGDR